MKKIIKNILLMLVIISAIGGQPVLAADYDLNTYVYNHLEDWDTEFSIDYYDKDVMDVVQNIAKKDDYLTLSLSKMLYRRDGDKATLEVTYKTTKEQEDYINKELSRVNSSIITANMTDFDKVKVINKYLINRFQYDDSHISNNAYSALTTGKTACEGYALTAYKMLKLAGIENRIVSGEINGVGHAWNLVKLNNKWYNLDITNNDATASNDYFLKKDDVLKNDGFTWKSSDYPASSENYDETTANISNSNAAVVNNITKGISDSAGYKSNLDGNWQLINSLWYFTKNTGNYATGWNIINNNWYCLGNDGAMKTGWIYSSGKWYYCYPDSGAMAVSAIIDGYKVDSNGAWIS